MYWFCLYKVTSWKYKHRWNYCCRNLHDFRLIIAIVIVNKSQLDINHANCYNKLGLTFMVIDNDKTWKGESQAHKFEAIITFNNIYQTEW